MRPAVHTTFDRENPWAFRHGKNYVQLIIVDDSERLGPTAMELLRDRYDRDNIANDVIEAAQSTLVIGIT